MEQDHTTIVQKLNAIYRRQALLVVLLAIMSIGSALSVIAIFLVGRDVTAILKTK